ncbi:AraC family transcriptional regulator [Comamonas sp. NLF-1-9]|uniref:AraC family transcriptional regulator n=1 Tax=Comamonas sp. NLF-1-9 TaxID=2853163 RepID=UPI001C465D33|nr:AraC family transcriptional regulator [Comamonas sp. NLF-1-9]QXL84374.1 AraC family transcriptional regulator [Comamonas sp. NLF-1-9]
MLDMRPARKPHARTPVALVLDVVRAYEVRAMRPEEALAQAQITPSQLKQPRGYVTATQFERLCAAAMRELDDEALGWFSRRLPWGSYGMLARASITSGQLGLALARWCRHHALLTDDITLTLSQGGDSARIAIAEHRPLGPGGALREICLLSTLRNLHGLACWLIDTRVRLARVQFPFAAPAHAEVYPLLFPGPIGFDAPQAAFEFDSRYLALPLTRDEAALQHMLQRALPLTVWQYQRERLLVARVRQLLGSDPAMLQSAVLVADALHLSERTLHRQLRQEGASLQQLKNEVRRAQAEHLLRHTERPVKQVAQAAGFASDKSFARAFRAWAGCSPQQYRASYRQSPST